MHVVMLSKACIVGAYQKKMEELARMPGVQLTVLAPPSWKDDRGEQKLERAFTAGYELRVTPIAFNGHFHFHFYPRLAAEIKKLRPDLLHIDEEPYNLATRHAMGLAAKLDLPAIFFTWQNISRNYPPPFSWWERYNYRHARHAIAGNHDAAAVLRAKGFSQPISVIPQFGVDPDIFHPAPSSSPNHTFIIGYAGGLVRAKGIDVLLQACAHLPQPWELHLVGTGPYQAELQALAVELGIDKHVRWLGKRPSLAMPEFYRTLDVLVLPSRTTPRWKEQFGRVLVEAMACEVAVIGSDSGEIPHVIGDAGLIFPEENISALAAHLRNLQEDVETRRMWGRRGRQRVLQHFTQKQIAIATAQVYEQVLA